MCRIIAVLLLGFGATAPAHAFSVDIYLPNLTFPPAEPAPQSCPDQTKTDTTCA